MTFIARILEDQEGATAIEYGLIVALISIGIIGALEGLGNQLNSTFGATSAAMAGSTGGSSGGTTSGGTTSGGTTSGGTTGGSSGGIIIGG